ncbi:MAG: SCO family protein [Bacteroidetes bacterium]|nr:MAG: SCO family protein [Bacteroidota bacterium]
MNKHFVLAILSLVLGMLACQTKEQRQVKIKTQLPVLGFKDLNEQGDTLYHTIPDFAFMDQDSMLVTPATFEGKVYVADFFFTSCPTICPRMKAQMLRLYEHFKDEPRVAFLSHSIDPEYDQVPVLKAYAEKLEISASRWHLVTGDKTEIYSIAKSYFENAAEDPNEPGGFIHSGAFYLVDTQRRIRGYYNGVDPAEVDQLMADIQVLLHEDQSAQ